MQFQGDNHQEDFWFWRGGGGGECPSVCLQAVTHRGAPLPAEKSERDDLSRRHADSTAVVSTQKTNEMKLTDARYLAPRTSIHRTNRTSAKLYRQRRWWVCGSHTSAASSPSLSFSRVSVNYALSSSPERLADRRLGPGACRTRSPPLRGVFVTSALIVSWPPLGPAFVSQSQASGRGAVSVKHSEDGVLRCAFRVRKGASTRRSSTDKGACVKGWLVRCVTLLHI